MIRKIAYSVVFGAMLTGLGACSAEPDYDNGALAQGENACSFARNQFNTSILPGSASFEVEVYRVGNVGDVTVPVTIEPVENSGMVTTGVTCSNAVFTDGSNKAIVTVSIADAVPPTVYGGNLVIGDKSTAGYGTMSFRVPVEYEWEDMEGTGWFKLPGFIFFDTWVEVEHWQKAKGFDRWRILNPMEKVYATQYPDSPKGGTWMWGGWTYDLNDATSFEFYDAGNGHISYEPFSLGMKFGKSYVGYYLPTNYKGTVGGKDYDYSNGNLDGSYWVEPLYGICAGYPTDFPMYENLIQFTMPGYGE